MCEPQGGVCCEFHMCMWICRQPHWGLPKPFAYSFTWSFTLYSHVQYLFSFFFSFSLVRFVYRYIVFEGEEGQDAGGLLREWYMIISREMFNPMYALFRTSPGDRVTYTINPSSHCNPNHLSYFKFVGRVVAKAVYDNRLLECYFTRSFYKHILGKSVRYQCRMLFAINMQFS